jgi:hypothetical protein
MSSDTIISTARGVFRDFATAVDAIRFSASSIAVGGSAATIEQYFIELSRISTILTVTVQSNRLCRQWLV